MRFMKVRRVYLILCVLGIVLPYLQFVPWLLEHGLNVTLFFRELLASRVSAFFAMDVIVSVIVLLYFIQSEGKRLRVPLLWLPSLATLIVGVSLGFPLFLFLRQLTLDRTNAEA
jgi:ABC-type Fe3+ transport system permease subunit